MAFKQQNNNQDEIISDINMTPLIDIMLVLLIIFMVTSSISLESGLSIDLPKTASKSEGKVSDAVIVSINHLGELFVQGKKVLWDDLQTQISSALKEAQSSQVILEGDKQSTLGRAIEIMDLAKKAGAIKFAIATDSQ